MASGHYAYYGMSGNIRRVRWFGHALERAWQKWLSRRDRGRAFGWNRMRTLLKRLPLPSPRIVHCYTK